MQISEPKSGLPLPSNEHELRRKALRSMRIGDYIEVTPNDRILPKSERDFWRRAAVELGMKVDAKTLKDKEHRPVKLRIWRKE